MNLEFLPLQPWIGVFTAAARDSEFWQREVRRPAIEPIARGNRGSTGSSAGIPMDAARALEHTVKAVGGDPTSSASSGKRRRRREAATVKPLWRRPRVCLLPHGRQPRTPRGNGLKVCSRPTVMGSRFVSFTRSTGNVWNHLPAVVRIAVRSASDSTRTLSAQTIERVKA